MSHKRSRVVVPAECVWPYGHITRITVDRKRNQFVKRIRGKLHNFGVCINADGSGFAANAKAALAEYQRVGPALHAGLEPDRVEQRDGMTVGELVGLYLQSKQADVEAGNLEAASYDDYEWACARMVASFGLKRTVATLRPLDFVKLLRAQTTIGPTRRTKFCTAIRMCFRWGHDKEVIETLPRFGKDFKGGNARDRRLLKEAQGDNMFSAVQVRRMLMAADRRKSPAMKAMVLLAINGGLGNKDCAALPLSALKLRPRDGVSMISFPRPKTGVGRQIPLWPETVEALEQVLAEREGRQPASPAWEDLVFLTSINRAPWKLGGNDAVGREFRKLMSQARVPGWKYRPRKQRQVDDVAAALRACKRLPPLKRARKGSTRELPRGDAHARLPLGFYTLRRTFRTIADEAGDQHASFRIMGQVIPGMAGVYVQRIETERLVKVVKHVRGWLWPGRPWEERGG